MKRIKNLLVKMSDEIRELGKRFPITIILIFFVTILFTITIDQNFSNNTEEMLEKIYLFCIIWEVGTIFTETWIVKKLKKMISYGLTGGINLIFVQILTANTGNRETSLRFLACYVMILILLSIYQAIKNAKLTFEEYFLIVFRDLFNTTVTYIILNIGMTILASIFIELILDGNGGSVIERLFVLLFGLFYVPSLVYTFFGISKKDVNSFIKGLVLYILLPLTTIAIAIIYLYIAKILILRDMPQNTIYRILAGIFIVAFPVWNMARNYAEENKIIEKVTKILPYLYTPFILLEVYSIGIRINGFGITPMRYISCMFIVFELMALVLTYYQRGKRISHLFIYTSVLVLVVFISPWNYENVSNWSQKRVIENLITDDVSFENLSNKNKDHVKSAYEYLKYKENEEKLIPECLSDEDKVNIEEYTNLERTNYDYPEYVSLDCEIELDIREYSKITYVEARNERENTIVRLEDEEQMIDLSDKINEIVKQKKKTNDTELEQYFKDNNIIRMSDTEDFYIATISFSYYESNSKIKYLRVEGYILER